MEKQYNPAIVEDKWYSRWMEMKFFRVDEFSSKPKYSIVIPPPNVTGVLHMGHALNNTIQDILIRCHRMQGCEALWMPGTDHAGIATQNVVERKLARGEQDPARPRPRGIPRRGLGVESTNTSHRSSTSSKSSAAPATGSANASPWTRACRDAVRRVFVQLYQEGLIYSGNYIINWCPRCRTALSDEEAEHKELNGNLYHLNYPYDGRKRVMSRSPPRGPRPCSATPPWPSIPKDERYAELVGKKIILPLVNREIPLIADDFVDRGFGTGAVKVTPRTIPTTLPWAGGTRMEPIVVMNEGGTMNGPIPAQYNGLDRFAAAKMIVEDLTALGLVEKIEDHSHAVGHCYRCHTVVEPYYSDQWFVRMKPLAQAALAGGA